MGGDHEASDCSAGSAADEADARPARRAPQQPAPSSGLDETQVEMVFEASKASMHALEAGCRRQERVGYFVEQEEGVERAVAVWRRERLRVRDQREDVRDGPVERPRSARRRERQSSDAWCVLRR